MIKQSFGAKWLSALLCLALLFSLAACGAQQPAPADQSAPEATQAPAPGNAPAAEPAPDESRGEAAGPETPLPAAGTASLLGGYIANTAVPGGHVEAGGKFYTDYATLAEEQQAAKELAVTIAEEGDVLLKNANHALPLSASEKRVTLFGMASIHLIDPARAPWATTASPPPPSSPLWRTRASW